VTPSPTPPPTLVCPYGSTETAIEDNGDDFDIEIPGEKNPEDIVAGSGRSVWLSPGQVVIISLDIANLDSFTLLDLRFKIAGARKAIINIRSEPPYEPFNEKFIVSLFFNSFCIETEHSYGYPFLLEYDHN
jgi:hypothetical protein